MVSPVAVAPRALRAAQQPLRQITQKRGLAAAASGSFQYEQGEAHSVQYASRDLPTATTTLAVVARAGSRYQPAPGLSDALEKFAYKVRDGIQKAWRAILIMRIGDNEAVCPPNHPRIGTVGG